MSSIILVGLNHRTAPIALRERLSLADESLRDGLRDLLLLSRTPGSQLRESAILSTCNRLEIYAVIDESSGPGFTAVKQFIAGLQDISLAELQPHLYQLEGHTAVEHLLRVAAGLDSMILGEPQILGQVSGASAEAQVAGTAGPVLLQLFNQAIRTGKRSRTETAISRYTTSVSHAAVQLIKERIGDLHQINILIVGAGEMAELAAKALQQHGAPVMGYINRTYDAAESMSQRFHGRAWHWYRLPEALVEADVVVTATGAPHAVIYHEDVAQILARRAGRPLLFVDIALPRDVEESVSQLPGIQCCDIDHLQSTVDANIAQRQAAVPEVEAIVDQEAAVFREWQHSRQVVPVLVELRQKARDVAAAELEIALRRLEGLDPQSRQAISLMAYRIVNKLLHEPTVRLKAHAATGNGYEYAQAIRELFALAMTHEGALTKDDEPLAADQLSVDYLVANRTEDA